MYRATRALRSVNSAHSERVRKAATNSILLQTYSKSVSGRFAWITVVSSAIAYSLTIDIQEAWEEYKTLKRQKRL